METGIVNKFLGLLLPIHYSSTVEAILYGTLTNVYNQLYQYRRFSLLLLLSSISLLRDP